MRSHAAMFLTGRLGALVILIAIQIVLVRALPPAQYAIYALTFGVSSLMQTAVSFGIQRVIAKFVSGAGMTVRNRTAARLVLCLVVIRITGSIVFLGLGLEIARLTGFLPEMPPFELLVIGGIFVLATTLALDLDAVAQALRLQRISRDCTLSEALLRFLLLLGFWHFSELSKAEVAFAIGTGTATLVIITLIIAIAGRLRAADAVTQIPRLDRDAVRMTALGGYASAMAWFVLSPAVVRLIGARLLQVQIFAGFAFAQSLVLSVQRYTPAMLLFPFVEPAVMRNFARTGDRSRLQSALALLIKVDAIVIGGGVVGAVIAGQPIVDLMTGGKYGALAYALPFLLCYIATNSIYRAFEVVAVALGAGSVLLRTLFLSLFWLAIIIPLTHRFGLIALLVCPIADALCRLALMYVALYRRDVRHVVDRQVTITLLAAVALLAAGGDIVAGAIDAGPVLRIVVGVAATGVYFACAALLRPLRKAELSILGMDTQNRVAGSLYRLARA